MKILVSLISLAYNSHFLDDADPLATINGDYPDFVNSTRRRRTEKLKRNMAVLEENLDEEPNEPSRVDNDEPAITGGALSSFFSLKFF